MARRNEGRGATDPTRREFFRAFGRETMRNAGAVAGAAAELRRQSGAAARQLFDPRIGEAAVTDASHSPADDEAVAESFRSAYRLGEDGLLIVDQRALPGRLSILTCHEASEVASAMRTGTLNSGPILGEVAGYALALAVGDVADHAQPSLDQVFGAAANTLRAARPHVNALRNAVDRMERRYESASATRGVSGQDLASALHQEADAIASEAQLAHAALGRSGAAVIAANTNELRGQGGPINLLMHADMGPLSCGMVGTGTAILQTLHDLGHAIHVWLTEAAPTMEGSRIADLQLTQIDVPHTVLPDTAVGWLLSERQLDGALLRGDTVCGNGDTVATIGSLNVARLAADAGVPVWIVAPPSAFAADAADGESLTLALHSVAEAAAAASSGGDEKRPAVFGVRLAPATDVVSRDLVSAFLTDAGPRPGGRG